MGHLTGKDIYRKVGSKIDNLNTRAPWNNSLQEIVKELYSEEEATLLVQMPYSLSTANRIAKIINYELKKTLGILENMADKGLVIDLYHSHQYYYMPSPVMIGIFEFTMMRTDHHRIKHRAELFNSYLSNSDDYYRANFSKNHKVSIARALPHTGTVTPEDNVEILSYEKAEAIVSSHDKFAIGSCACRHEKLHANQKNCDTPLDTCSSFGYAADYLIRHGLGREVSRDEMSANLERCKNLGLVFSADNVQRNVSFICCCCSCCCNLLQGINKYGYPNTVVTSTFIASVDKNKCTGCGKCAKKCPINAIAMIKEGPNPLAEINKEICLGCGVCSLKCPNASLKLKKRQQQVIHPETIFERIILSSLERNSLQNLIFDNPQSVTHKVMRGFIGGFLGLPPVKKTLMSNLFRSRFLSLLATGTGLQGNKFLTKL